MTTITKKDLDIAIEKCERIMEFDTRTLKNPESENGYIFEKIYDLLQFLQQFQFAIDTNVAATDTISRQAMINEINLHVGILYDNPTLVESLKLLVRSLPPVQQIPWDKNTRNSMVFTLRTVLTGGDMDAIDDDNVKRLIKWLEEGEL